MSSNNGSRSYERAMREFCQILGDNNVLDILANNTLGDQYLDPFRLRIGNQATIGAVVLPQSTLHVQSIVQIAASFGVPLWPISRGKNLGYGGAEPVVTGSVVVDLSRMNRILEIDERAAYCEIEPGVSFFDLFHYLQSNRIPLWNSVPGHGWGSIIGNALERGLGHSPYGDHADCLCGLEVVLPNGDIIRTGMGAMAASNCWHRYRHALGPSWEQLFIQSNFGIVTRAGVWLMPEPEATMKAQVHLRNFDDIAPAIDALSALRLRNVLEHPVGIASYVHQAAVISRRIDWYRGADKMPQNDRERMMRDTGIGYWTFSVMLFGYHDVIRAKADVVRKAFAPHFDQSLLFHTWMRGEAITQSAAPIPSSEGLKAAKWYGSRGGHISFSPVLPADGAVVLRHAQRSLNRFDEFGLDYSASFSVGPRHIQNINTLLFDRADQANLERTQALYRALSIDAARDGLGQYRAHIDFMDDAASQFDFNDGALCRLNKRIKDALDPSGILAPGKNGIWPSNCYRRD
jgi:4-cresol dehydrogenase (hydroxylating)